jgi:transcriptional regulator with XRE-family HTH domain
MTTTSDADPTLLGRRVRQLRLLQALSQADLAEIAGVSAAAIIRIERGTHTARPSTLRKLAQALGVKPTQLTSNQ